jgi:uncharacterized protein YraI
MKKLISVLITAGFLISSCNIPTGVVTDSAVSTSAALTVQAALNANPQASATAAPAGVNVTATFSEPHVSVGDVTNCRSGPGTNYERITQITPGEQVKVIGSFNGNYWIVSSAAGVCWVSAEFATPIGSVDVVPTVTAPPTPVGNAPTGVSLQKWDIFCNYQTDQADVNLIWSDKTPDEIGYRILRNDGVVAELPANTTQYAETITLLSGQSVAYRVEVFNSIGTASSSTIALYC